MTDEDDFPERDPNEKLHDVSGSLNAPRKKHGTRVAITFVCSGCGTESQLDYKPRGVALTELLCETCMGAKEGSDRWKLVREKKKFETTQRTYRVTCSECGFKDTLSRAPKGQWICNRCKNEHATPDPTRLEAMEAVEGEPQVFVRRKKPDA